MFGLGVPELLLVLVIVVGLIVFPLLQIRGFKIFRRRM